MRALPRARLRATAAATAAARARARALTRWLADAEGLPLDGTRSLTFCHDRQDKMRLASRDKRAQTLQRVRRETGGRLSVHLVTPAFLQVSKRVERKSKNKQLLFAS